MKRYAHDKFIRGQCAQKELAGPAAIGVRYRMGDQILISFWKHVKLLVTPPKLALGVVGYGPFSLYVIHKNLCPSNTEAKQHSIGQS
jgi:hypothetical protein